MRQDLITPYNVLFCGCLAYTPVPVCRLGNTVNTPMALFCPLLSPLFLSFSFFLTSFFRRASFSFYTFLSLSNFLSLSYSLRLSLSSSLSTSSFSYSSSKCGWFVCTCHKACLQPLPPGRSTSRPPSGACVLLYALLYESHTFAEGIRELILI